MKPAAWATGLDTAIHTHVYRNGVSRVRFFSRTPSTQEIAVEAARALQLDGATLIDVREAHEWAKGHATGARHVPLGKIAGPDMNLPSGATVLVICARGHRSRGAARFLSDQGYDAKSVRGGTSAWSRANLPMTT